MELLTTYPVLVSLLISAIGWLVWFAVRNYITPSPLDKIPGPKPKSLLKGAGEVRFIAPNNSHLYLYRKYGAAFAQTWLGFC